MLKFELFAWMVLKTKSFWSSTFAQSNRLHKKTFCRNAHTHTHTLVACSSLNRLQPNSMFVISTQPHVRWPFQFIYFALKAFIRNAFYTAFGVRHIHLVVWVWKWPKLFGNLRHIKKMNFHYYSDGTNHYRTVLFYLSQMALATFVFIMESIKRHEIPAYWKII